MRVIKNVVVKIEFSSHVWRHPAFLFFSCTAM